MNEREQAALDALITSKKYGGVCPDTVRRVFTAELAKRKNVKDADKAARARLHAVTGAFMQTEELKAARKAVIKYLNGDPGAISHALSQHASTRERLGVMDELYARIFARTGRPDMIFDLACGLNPLYLGAKGYAVRGFDIHGGCVDLINACAESAGWDVKAVCADLFVTRPEGKCAVALAMKLLPVLETEKPGSAMELLSSFRADGIAATFPTRTLGGRGVGMEKKYSQWFEANLPRELSIAERFVLGGELVYIVS